MCMTYALTYYTIIKVHKWSKYMYVCTITCKKCMTTCENENWSNVNKGTCNTACAQLIRTWIYM